MRRPCVLSTHHESAFSPERSSTSSAMIPRRMAPASLAKSWTGISSRFERLTRRSSPFRILRCSRCIQCLRVYCISRRLLATWRTRATRASEGSEGSEGSAGWVGDAVEVDRWAER